jgi:hypothetical protein
MYGVPQDLPALRDFHGRSLAGVDDRDNIVYFRFRHPDAPGELVVGVEGTWRLRGADGSVIAEGSPSIGPQRHLLPLEQSVQTSRTRPPDSACLLFVNGQTLEFIDDSAEHECFSIPHAAVYI